MSAKEGAVLHTANSESASTVGNVKFGPSGVMAYRVVMAGNNGLFAVVVEAASGDDAAANAHAKHPGNKVTLVEPAQKAA